MVSFRGEIVVLWTWRTRQAPQPGRCSCRGHGQYRHCSPVSSLYCAIRYLPWWSWQWRSSVPDGKHTSSLGEAGLLLDAADPLLQDGGNLGGGGLRIGSVETGGVGERGSAGLLVEKSRQYCVLGGGELSGSRRIAAPPAQFHRRSSIAAPMASEFGSTSFWRWLDGRQAQLRAVAMDLPKQSCWWQRLQRPGGSTGGWPLRTWLRLLKSLFR